MRRLFILLSLFFFLILILITPPKTAYALSLKTIVPMSSGYDQILTFFENDKAIRIIEGGFYGLIDRKGRLIVEAKYNSINPFSEGVAGVYDGKLWGFIDEKGEIIIPFEYLSVSEFIDGFAVVNKDGVYGAIDKNGKERISFKYQNLGNPGQGVYPARINEKWGYVNRMGIEVLPFIYDDAKEFSEGYAAVKRYGKWGLIDKTGQIFVNHIYDHIDVFKNGYANVVRNGRIGIMDRYGTVSYNVADLQPENSVIHLIEKNDKKGVSDINGNLIIPIRFSDIVISGNRFVALSDGEKFGLYELTRIGGNLTFEKPEEPAVMLDGVYIAFDQKPVIENDRVLAPLRHICESLNLNMTYDSKFTTIVVEKDGIRTVFNMGSDIAYVNGKEQKLDSHVRIIGGRTYVPVRFIADTFGYNTYWDIENKTVIISAK